MLCVQHCSASIIAPAGCLQPAHGINTSRNQQPRCVMLNTWVEFLRYYAMLICPMMCCPVTSDVAVEIGASISGMNSICRGQAEGK